MILTGVNANDVRASLVAPCTHDRPCPLSPGLFCSFSQKVYGAMIRKASLEKFSYVVIQKQVKHRPSSNSWTEMSTPSASPVNAVKVTSTSLELVNRILDADRAKIDDSVINECIEELNSKNHVSKARRNEWGRVLRSPLKRRKHVIIDFCSSEGVIKRSILSRKSVQHIDTFYTAAKKTTWGGLHPIVTNFEVSEKLRYRNRDHLFSMHRRRKHEVEKIESKVRRY